MVFPQNPVTTNVPKQPIVANTPRPLASRRVAPSPQSPLISSQDESVFRNAILGNVPAQQTPSPPQRGPDQRSNLSSRPLTGPDGRLDEAARALTTDAGAFTPAHRTEADFKLMRQIIQSDVDSGNPERVARANRLFRSMGMPRPMPTAEVPGISTPRELPFPATTDMPVGQPLRAFPRYQPSDVGMPVVAGGQPGMRNPLPAPGMDIPGSVITPEGMLADRIAGMSMQPDPAEVAEQTAIAQALGEQRYNESDVARMQGGRMADMTANRNMGQMAGGNYADMTPERAAMSSRNMYRGGGMGGASMAAREDAIEQALRAQPAAGPSLQERTAGTRQEMQGMVSQALQAQGGEMNPQAGFEQNARMLQPGTTLRGTSADGTPMIVSRGSAGTRDDRSRLAQQETNQRVRQERIAGLRNAGQMRMARNAAMQEAASNPMNSPMFAALMANDPRGAAAMMQAQGNMQLGQMEVAQRAQAAKQQFDIETQRLQQMGVIGQAEAAERNARAESSLAEASAIRDALTPEGQDRAQRNALVQNAAASGMVTPQANLAIGSEINRLLGGGQQANSTVMPPLLPKFGKSKVEESEIKARVKELESFGQSGEQIVAELESYGIPKESIDELIKKENTTFSHRVSAGAQAMAPRVVSPLARSLAGRVAGWLQ